MATYSIKGMTSHIMRCRKWLSYKNIINKKPREFVSDEIGYLECCDNEHDNKSWI